MNNSRVVFLIVSMTVLISVIWLVGCSSKPAAPSLTPDSPQVKIFAPLPEFMESEDNPITEDKITLGRILYFDPRLSKGQDIPCNDCHQLDQYGVDNESTSEGHKGVRGDRNSPTVYNAAAHFTQFWDGREPHVEAQAKGPVLNPVEMAMPSEDHVLLVLKSIPEYEKMFQAAFPEASDPITYDNMAAAIGAFERKLITRDRFDKFLKGDATALNEAELAGLQDFVGANCQTCHMGALLGGNMFQKLGIVQAWPDESDTGRHMVTKNEADKMMFKVPSLRNIAKTGPYFHDGQVATLEEAVGLMADYEIGKQLTGEQVASIVTFLNALTGELPVDYIQAPELPESTAKTPKPDSSD